MYVNTEKKEKYILNNLIGSALQQNHDLKQKH